MTLFSYRCGCREELPGLTTPGRRCPIHGASARSAIVCGKAAFELAYGPGSYPAIPANGLFHPNLEAAP